MSSLLSALGKPSVTNQPPSAWENRRNDIVIILWFVFMLLLGMGIRNITLNASRPLALGQGLPTIAVPAGWSITKSENLALQAKNLASPSTFDAELDVFVGNLADKETLDIARSAWSLKRSQTLSQYRELSVENVKVLGNAAGLRTTYAYVADPTRESGANGLPVVVEAQDLIFVQGKQLIVVTTAADANEWSTEANHFRLVQESLKVQPTENGPQVQGGVK